MMSMLVSSFALCGTHKDTSLLFLRTIEACVSTLSAKINQSCSATLHLCKHPLISSMRMLTALLLRDSSPAINAAVHLSSLIRSMLRLIDASDLDHTAWTSR